MSDLFNNFGSRNKIEYSEWLYNICPDEICPECQYPGSDICPEYEICQDWHLSGRHLPWWQLLGWNLPGMKFARSDICLNKVTFAWTKWHLPASHVFRPNVMRENFTRSLFRRKMSLQAYFIEPYTKISKVLSLSKVGELGAVGSSWFLFWTIKC
jgi:hypothetical protein